MRPRAPGTRTSEVGTAGVFGAAKFAVALWGQADSRRVVRTRIGRPFLACGRYPFAISRHLANAPKTVIGFPAQQYRC